MANQSVNPPIRALGRDLVGALLVIASTVGATWIGSTLIGWRAWALLGCLAVLAVGLVLLVHAAVAEGEPSGNGAETGRAVSVDIEDPDAFIPGR